MWNTLYKAQKVQKYALNSQLEALQFWQMMMKLKIEVFLVSSYVAVYEKSMHGLRAQKGNLII